MSVDDTASVLRRSKAIENNRRPSVGPSFQPSSQPTYVPSVSASVRPSLVPSLSPSLAHLDCTISICNQMHYLKNLTAAVVFVILRNHFIMSSFYNSQSKQKSIGPTNVKPCRKVIHKGWKYKVRNRTCICAVALPESERQKAEEECSERMKSMIDQEDASMCTLILVNPTRRRRDDTVNTPRELLRSRIFDIFGVKPDDHEARKHQQIYIRPLHFHRSFLRTNNEGPIQPMKINNAEDLVSTTSALSLETSMLHLNGVFHPLPTICDNICIETLGDKCDDDDDCLLDTFGNECDGVVVCDVPKTPSHGVVNWFQKRKRSTNLTSARKGEDRHRTWTSATPTIRKESSPISKITKVVRSVGKERRSQSRKAKQRQENSNTSEVDGQEIQQQDSINQVTAAATRRGLSDISNLLSNRRGEFTERNFSSIQTPDKRMLPTPTRDDSNTLLAKNYTSTHQQSPLDMSLDVSFNSQTETHFRTIHPQDNGEPEDVSATIGILFPENTEDCSPSSTKSNREEEQVQGDDHDRIPTNTNIEKEVLPTPANVYEVRQRKMQELYQFTASVIGSDAEKDLDQSKFQKYFTRLRYGNKASKTSHYRLKNVIGHAVDALTATIWPTFNKEERILALIEQLHLLLDKNKMAEEKTIAKTGSELCKYIASKKTPRERRPLLAFVRKAGATKKVAMEMLSRTISNYEWKMVGQHCKYPGPGEPIKRMHPVRYQRVNMSNIDTMFEFLQDRNYLEATSYGIKNVRTCNGQIKQIESVKRTLTISEMYREFIKGLASMINPEGDEDDRNLFLDDDDYDDYDDPRSK